MGTAPGEGTLHRMLSRDEIPRDLPLFDGVKASKIDHLLECYNARLAELDAGEVIATADGTPGFVAYLMTGRALACTYDEQGNRTIMHELMPGQALFCRESSRMALLREIVVTTCEQSRVLYFSVPDAELRGDNCVLCAKMVLGNLALSLGSLNAELMAAMDIRRRRTTRGKLIAYLQYEAHRHGASAFDVTLNRQELADFLCIDRAALSRELSGLRDEGQIEYDRSHFELHLRPPVRRGAQAGV